MIIRDGNGVGQADVIGTVPTGTEQGLVTRSLSPLLSTSGTITANGQDVTADLTNLSVAGLTVQITGTWSGTLSFQGSNDGGTTWVATSVTTAVATGAILLTTTTTNNLFVVIIAGAGKFRVTATAWTSGTANIYIRHSDTPSPLITGNVRIGSAATLTANTTEQSVLNDNAAFTDGTSKVWAAGHILDETAGTALTENDIAAARIDSKRAQIFAIEDATTRGRRAVVDSTGSLQVAASAVTPTYGNFAITVANEAVDIAVGSYNLVTLEISGGDCDVQVLGSFDGGGTYNIAIPLQKTLATYSLGAGFLSLSATSGTDTDVQAVIAGFTHVRIQGVFNTTTTTVYYVAQAGHRPAVNYSTLADPINDRRYAAITAGNALKTDSSATTQPVSGTVAATQSGTWTVQPGNTQNTTPWLVKEGRSSTCTTSAVADTAVSTTLLSSNASRLGASVTNDSSAALYIKCGTTASTTDYDVRLVQYAYWECPFGYTGRIDGIWASDPNDGAARIGEYT